MAFLAHAKALALTLVRAMLVSCVQPTNERWLLALVNAERAPTAALLTWVHHKGTLDMCSATAATTAVQQACNVLTPDL